MHKMSFLHLTCQSESPSTPDHLYFCNDRFYTGVNSRHQVNRVGYIKYDLLKCSDASGLQA